MKEKKRNRDRKELKHQRFQFNFWFSPEGTQDTQNLDNSSSGVSLNQSGGVEGGSSKKSSTLDGEYWGISSIGTKKRERNKKKENRKKKRDEKKDERKTKVKKNNETEKSQTLVFLFLILKGTPTENQADGRRSRR